MELAEAMMSAFIPDSPEDIILRYQDMVYRIAFTYSRNPADAEDVTQEVFIRYLTKMPDFKEEEHLKAWLIRVTVNVSKSFLRSAWFRKTATFTEVDAPYADEPLNEDTYHAVMSLPEKYRSVVLLYYFEEYSVREVAKILRRTESLVQTQLQRARSMLKTKLKEDWQND